MQQAARDPRPNLLRRLFTGRDAPPRVAVRLLLWNTKGLCFWFFIRLIRGGECVLGPRFLPIFILPFILRAVLQWPKDRVGFERFRKSKPAAFWSESSFRHYLHMIHVWHESLAIALLYDRLDSPDWNARMTVSGEPLARLKSSGARPVVLVFLHTGGFAFLRYWLRSRGIHAMSWLRSVPRVLSTLSEGIRKKGDSLYGMSGLPHTFTGPQALGPAIRSLAPGKLLIFSLEGTLGAETPTTCVVDGNILSLQDGAVRVARRVGAILLPVSVRRLGSCRYQFRFGSPVPDDLVCRPCTQGAMDCLARQFWAELVSDPSSIGWSTMATLAPGLQPTGRFP